jgi:hypothetical protein
MSDTRRPTDTQEPKLTDKQRGDLGYRYLDWAVRTKKIPSGGFRILYAISQRFNEDNPFESFPSLEYIAAYIRRSPSTVWSMMPKLAKVGAIEITWGSQGSRNSNRYRLPQEFLDFYFGPDKGRLPKVEKKPRHIGVSKPRFTSVSELPNGTSETPVCQSINPDIPNEKPRHIGVNHFLATKATSKSAPLNGARTDRVDIEGPVTAFDIELAEEVFRDCFPSSTPEAASAALSRALHAGIDPCILIQEAQSSEETDAETFLFHCINPSFASKGFQVSLGSS